MPNRPQGFPVTDRVRELVRQALVDSGTNQRQLAFDVGCSPPTIKHILDGTIQASEYLLPVLIALDIPVHNLLPLDDDERECLDLLAAIKKMVPEERYRKWLAQVHRWAAGEIALAQSDD